MKLCIRNIIQPSLAYVSCKQQVVIQELDDLFKNLTFSFSVGEYKYAGRDTLLFLVDASRSMFDSYNDDDSAPFDMTIQVRLPIRN